MSRRPSLFALVVFAFALALGATSCGSDDPVTTDGTTSSTDTTISATTDDETTTSDTLDESGAIAIGELFDGDGARAARLEGFVLWDNASARLCSVMMESFPPQCGSPWIVIANPEALTVELTEAQETRWTDASVELDGTFDGSRFVLDAQAELAVATASDVAIVEAFIALASDTTPANAEALPFADQVVVGLSDIHTQTSASADLGSNAGWEMEVSEYAGFGGPFSALMAEEPYQITVGRHPRCAGPPVAPPAGFAEHRHISIQPTGIDSCIAWWTVDFFIDDNGEIGAVTLDLFGP